MGVTQSTCSSVATRTVVERLRDEKVPSDTMHLACAYRYRALDAGVPNTIELATTCAHIAHKFLHDELAPGAVPVLKVEEARVLCALQYRLRVTTRHDLAREALWCTDNEHLRDVVDDLLCATQAMDVADEHEAWAWAERTAFETTTTPPRDANAACDLSPPAKKPRR